MRPHDGRALSARGVDRIQHNLFKGRYDDGEIQRLFETIRVQKRVLKQLFDLFKTNPKTRESTADALRNSTLAHYKELVAMEDPRTDWG